MIIWAVILIPRKAYTSLLISNFEISKLSIIINVIRVPGTDCLRVIHVAPVLVIKILLIVVFRYFQSHCDSYI